MTNSGEVIGTILLLGSVYCGGLMIGDTIGEQSFINANYGEGKQFTVIEKTIKADEFSYKITNGKKRYTFSTKDNIEMNATITIGAK